MLLGFIGHILWATPVGTRGTPCFANKDVYVDYGLTRKRGDSGRLIMWGNLIHVEYVRPRVCMPETRPITLDVVLLALLGMIETHRFLWFTKFIFGFSGYRVKYYKGCRVKQHDVEFLCVIGKRHIIKLLGFWVPWNTPVLGLYVTLPVALWHMWTLFWSLFFTEFVSRSHGR